MNAIGFLTFNAWVRLRFRSVFVPVFFLFSRREVDALQDMRR